MLARIRMRGRLKLRGSKVSYRVITSWNPCFCLPRLQYIYCCIYSTLSGAVHCDCLETAFFRKLFWFKRPNWLRCLKETFKTTDSHLLPNGRSMPWHFYCQSVQTYLVVVLLGINTASGRQPPFNLRTAGLGPYQSMMEFVFEECTGYIVPLDRSLVSDILEVLPN